MNLFHIEKFKEKYSLMFENNLEYDFITYSKENISLKHLTCNNIFDISSLNIYSRNIHNNCLCTICYPISDNKSIKERELTNWLLSINQNLIENDKTILKPKHLDILLPDNNLAIEFNGLYWHSEEFRDKTYHLNKSLKCLEQNIQLIHIWEDEWIYKKEIVKSIILNKLNIIPNKIYGRKCVIREVNDTKIVRKFLDDNHIQGYSQSTIKLGLYYEKELVSLMTFGYRHTNTKKEFELIRFCNKINYCIIGAANKLFKYFIINYNYDNIISYSDFRLFDGKLYETLGFKKIHLTKPDYFWTKGSERKHRFNFNKQKLIKDGYDPNKTEIEIMWERGWKRIWGCGQYRWEYKNT